MRGDELWVMRAAAPRAARAAAWAVDRPAGRARGRRGAPEAVSADSAARRRIAASARAAAVALMAWSAAYIARQSAFDGTAALSPVGDFALEGMLLALAWLAAIVAGCAVVLGGGVVLAEPTGD